MINASETLYFANRGPYNGFIYISHTCGKLGNLRRGAYLMTAITFEIIEDVISMLRPLVVSCGCFSNKLAPYDLMANEYRSREQHILESLFADSPEAKAVIARYYDSLKGGDS